MTELYQSHRHRLIIAADDFGISPRANRNMRYLMSLGKIDRVGILVHGILPQNEIEELMKSKVKLDIHLDILHEFHEDRRKRTGAITRSIEFLLKCLFGKITSKKIEVQWREQIEKFKEIFGKYPDGISSHEHIHFFPPFFSVALKLQSEYSIPYIRFGQNSFLIRSKLVANILHWLRIINKKICPRSDYISSNSFVSLDWISNVDTFLEELPEGTIEIACHPEIARDFVKIKQYF